ncbi:hypothetical protein MSAR_04160 [Mycolicibacterium sarraceniae]|uniref:Uncharacterized protein n=1 Tax=Mycolicibacterium sarraceniae TaxID=1534348 RepID=A0A7I7SLA4_9MYCO|nr:hypothetical protein MSAR_04160 [Mycolicibacterium sarraceniae]
MLFHEDRPWELTTFTVGHTTTPQTFDDMCAVADAVLPASVATAIRHGEPLGGIVPLGDAVARLNPTYGQGMTVAVLPAGHLRRLLKSGAIAPARDPDPARDR